MIESDLIRQVLLGLTGLVFLALAIRVFFSPAAVAGELGYELQRPNGYNELFAIYFGLWLATAGLAFFAAGRVQNALPGDIVAVLVLAQPVGRVVAGLRFGWPQGPLMGFFVLEILGGLLLLGVRPSG